MICPNCNQEINDNSIICKNCKFDIALYKETYQRIYNEKLKQLNQSEKHDSPKEHNYSAPQNNSSSVRKPRCPFCNSDDLTKITSFDRAVNAAMFGLLGNKRKYQWHCNNCKTNW